MSETFHSLVVRAEHREVVGHALPRAWRGGEAHVVDLVVGETAVTFISPGPGAAASRAARWPDLLTDWRDIYDERLFPADAVPVLAEEASGLGADALAIWGELGLARACVGWYRKGTLVEYEHVGSAQVAWTPAAGLGRPFDGSTRQAAASASRRVAQLLGAGDFAGTFERLEQTSKAIGEAILVTALTRLLGDEPPPLDDLAGRIARAPVGRVRLG